jgi:single-strand DNA-binding protein
VSDKITIIGNVGTPPITTRKGNGKVSTRFRMASNGRRFDRTHNVWVDVEPNWYEVVAFDALAEGIDASVSKGQPVVVTGELKISEWHNGERGGTNIDIRADAVGHDLRFGITEFTKTAGRSHVDPDADELPEPGAPDNELQKHTTDDAPDPGHGQPELAAASPNGDRTPF